jgi:hypothetical protein
MSRIQRVRMVVRLASLLLSLFFLWNVAAVTLTGQLHIVNLPFTLALALVAIACIAAWRWERAGGLAVIISGIVVGLSASVTIAAAGAYIGVDLTPQAIAGLIWALPFVIFGLLFRALAAREARLSYGS